MKPLGIQATDKEIEKEFFVEWATGWRIGYYTKPDKPVRSPYEDSDQKWHWNLGVLAGAEAREKLDPWENAEQKNAVKEVA